MPGNGDEQELPTPLPCEVPFQSTDPADCARQVLFRVGQFLLQAGRFLTQLVRLPSRLVHLHAGIFRLLAFLFRLSPSLFRLQARRIDFPLRRHPRGLQPPFQILTDLAQDSLQPRVGRSLLPQPLKRLVKIALIGRSRVGKVGEHHDRDQNERTQRRREQIQRRHAENR